MADIIQMDDPSNKCGKKSKPSSSDQMTATIEEELEDLRADFQYELAELRANFQYVCDICEDALENYPEDIRKLLSALRSINKQCTEFWRIAEDYDGF
jgi:hypothetical protein